MRPLLLLSLLFCGLFAEEAVDDPSEYFSRPSFLEFYNEVLFPNDDFLHGERALLIVSDGIGLNWGRRAVLRHLSAPPDQRGIFIQRAGRQGVLSSQFKDWLLASGSWSSSKWARYYDHVILIYSEGLMDLMSRNNMDFQAYDEETAAFDLYTRVRKLYYLCDTIIALHDLPNSDQSIFKVSRMKDRLTEVLEGLEEFLNKLEVVAEEKSWDHVIVMLDTLRTKSLNKIKELLSNKRRVAPLDPQ